MASTAQFAATPRLERVVISTANTNRDGTGTIGQVMVGGASGTRVERIRIKANVTTTAGMVRMFTYDGAASPTYELFDETSVAAITPSATVQTFEADIVLGTTQPLFIPSGKALGFSTHNAEEFVITVIGADL
jgi:hypothetical protein